MIKRLNICVLINDVQVPLWIYKTIENLTLSEFAFVTLIVSRAPADDTKEHPISKGSAFLIRLFESIDRLLFRSKHYSHQDTLIASLKGVESVIILNNSAGLDQETIKTDAISDLNPDVIILFGRHIINNTIWGIPKYGIWTFSLNDCKTSGMPAQGFWEVIKHEPLTDMWLEILTDDHSQNSFIYFSRESTYHYSVTENRNRLFGRATVVLPRLIKGLSRYGESYLNQMMERYKAFIPATGRSARSVSFPTVLRDLVTHLRFVFRLGIYKVFHTDAFSWQLRTNIISDNNPYWNNFSTYNTIHPAHGLFWADPFIIADESKYYVFVEEFIYKTNKAHLSVLQLDSDGKLLDSRKILERPYHLSYPFVFKIDGIYYMIPETNQNKTIELYKCSEFPYKWKFEKYIMENISATDTTLFHYENRWWLFTTIDQTRGISSCSTELFLFYSDDPLQGNWVSHPQNPIVSDESRARCAGRLFIHNGKICRPSQDCSIRYGRGLNINHVTKLNEQEYNEVLIEEIKPDWDSKLKGLHTINNDKGMVIIDTYKYHRRLSL